MEAESRDGRSPRFLEINYAHLVNTPLSVVLPYSFFPFGVYLTYIYFSSAVPNDLIAAAKVDGCGETAAFFRIALPLAAPIVALVGFFSFVANWNNSSTPTFNPVVSPGAAIQLPQLALATVISISPVLVIFLLAQRFLVTGLTAGATKG